MVGSAGPRRSRVYWSLLAGPVAGAVFVLALLLLGPALASHDDVLAHGTPPATTFHPSLDDGIQGTPGWSDVSDYTEVPGSDDKEPAPMQMASMAYDPTEQAAVIFGGMNASNQTVNDTWLYIAGEDEWLGVGKEPEIGNPAGPPPVLHPGLAYDYADGYLLLFGGQLASGAPYGGTWAFGGNTWFNLSWTNLTSHVAQAPPPTEWPLMTYDAMDGAVLLYTGSASSSTWEFHGGNWAQVAVGGTPPAREGGTLAYDTAEDEAVLYGGTTLGPTPAHLHDSWAYANDSWTAIVTPSSPPAFPWESMAYDDSLSALVMIGGGPALQTWTFQQNSWTNVTPNGGPVPPVVTGFSVTYEAPDAWVMLYGGSNGNVTAPTLDDDVWGWNYPLQPAYTGLESSPLSTETWTAILLVATLPAIAALLYTRWPRRPQVTDVSAEVPAGVVSGSSATTE